MRNRVGDSTRAVFLCVRGAVPAGREPIGQDASPKRRRRVGTNPVRDDRIRPVHRTAIRGEGIELEVVRLSLMLERLDDRILDLGVAKLRAQHRNVGGAR